MLVVIFRFLIFYTQKLVAESGRGDKHLAALPLGAEQDIRPGLSVGSYDLSAVFNEQNAGFIEFLGQLDRVGSRHSLSTGHRRASNRNSQA